LSILDDTVQGRRQLYGPVTEIEEVSREEGILPTQVPLTVLFIMVG